MRVHATPRRRTSGLPKLSAAAALALALQVWPVLAQSARATLFVQMLQRNPDARVRVSAALRLGETGEAEAVPGMLDAFGAEHDPTVQAAILSALASLHDRRAIPLAQRALTHANPAVRTQARRTLDLLDPPPAPTAPPPPSEAEIAAARARARGAVVLGGVSDRTGTGDTLVEAARAGLRDCLSRRLDVLVLPPGARPPTQTRGRFPMHVIDGTVSLLTRGATSVRATFAIAVSTYPGHVFEFDTQSSITISGGDGSAQAADEAVHRAAESACARALGQLFP